MTARHMTPARKRRLWEAAGGLCEACKLAVPMTGPTVRYDHRIPLWTSGDDSDANLRPLHLGCDRPKTAADKADIAKVKRLIRANNPETRKPTTMTSRGFEKHPTKRRTFSGQVVSR